MFQVCRFQVHRPVLAALGFLLLQCFSGHAGAESRTLYFGIVPQQSATRLAEIWVPFIERVAAETGLNIRFATTKDIPTFERCLAQGAYEFAYMNPYHYTVFSETPGYRAFAKQKDKSLQGIIVVRKDNPAKSLEDLAGSKVSLPSPAAFGASVLPRAELQGRGVEFEAVYVKSHDSVYRAVASGLTSAGGGVQQTFDTFDAEIREQLRIVYVTRQYTPHAFAHSQSVPLTTARMLAASMIKVAENAPQLMTELGMQAFVTAQDSDWDDVRQLGLTLSETEILQEGRTKCRSD
jgi:phosphonate transport system substrate-binding protein